MPNAYQKRQNALNSCIKAADAKKKGKKPTPAMEKKCKKVLLTLIADAIHVKINQARKKLNKGELTAQEKNRIIASVFKKSGIKLTIKTQKNKK